MGFHPIYTFTTPNTALQTKQRCVFWLASMFFWCEEVIIKRISGRCPVARELMLGPDMLLIGRNPGWFFIQKKSQWCWGLGCVYITTTLLQLAFICCCLVVFSLGFCCFFKIFFEAGTDPKFIKCKEKASNEFTGF